MSTPFEYGAGFQDGNDFRQDQDGEIMFRLNTGTAAQTVTAAAGATPIVWETISGVGASKAYMNTAADTFTPTAPGLYRFSGQITIGTVVTTVTNFTVALRNSNSTTGRYNLINIPGAVVAGNTYTFDVVVPIIPISGTLYGYRLDVTVTGVGSSVDIDYSTSGVGAIYKTYLDIQELASQPSLTAAITL